MVLTWDPSGDANVVGYRIYLGTASRSYTNSLDVGGATNATITVPDSSATYYFAATSYNAFGDESGFSNETVLSPATQTLAAVPGAVAVAAAKVTVVTNPAALTGMARTKGRFSFKVSGTTNAIYIIESSTNLVNWVPVATNAAPFNFLDATATAPQQFYRAVGAAVTVPAPGVLTAAAKTAAKQFSFTVSGSSNAQYVVEASTDLKTWVPLQTNAVPFVFVDTNANLPQRFYRATGVVTAALPAATATPPVAPTMSTVPLSAGKFGFNIAGTAGAQYVVQASTNLVDWAAIQTNAAPFTFVDTNTAAFSRRFFRAFALKP